MPSSKSREAELAALGARPFAHRGLHGGGTPENSRAAFAAAVAGGFGIELDVQAAAFGEAVVFHDDRLDRLTSETGAVADREIDAIAAILLKGTQETIAPLADALRLIGGRTPLLIEVKARGRAYHQLCYSVAMALQSYEDPVGVMSFNPQVGWWFARHAPQRLRGLVVSEQGKGKWRGRIERNLALWRARPDFLAYDIRDLPSDTAALARFDGRPIYTWTVRGDEDRARAAEFADQIIFEQPAP
jgi:glycerophosphoryl diester phosphodiesterase